MAEAGSYSEARTGNWLWALLVGAILLVMELILFAALVPATWSERVRATELAWLHQGLGPSTAKAVVERADDWYGTLFVEPGLVETSYRITLPNDEDVQRAGALSPLATLPLWTWVAGRLEVDLGGALPGTAASGNARRLVAVSPAPPRRRLGRWLGASAHSPVRIRLRESLAHAYALRGIVVVAIVLGLVLFLPVPLPVLGVPIVAALIGLLGGRDRRRCAEAPVIIGSDQAPPVSPSAPTGSSRSGPSLRGLFTCRETGCIVQAAASAGFSMASRPSASWLPGSSHAA